MSKRVIIAGGGLIGCSIAWRLAQRGARVTLYEAARPGMAASWAAAGMLAPMLESEHPAFRALAAESSRRFPAFVGELRQASGIEADLLLSGKLDLAFSGGQLQALRSRYGAPLPAGVQEISLGQAHRLEPALTDAAIAVIRSEHDGSVNNRKLARAAWVAASEAGVDIVSGNSVAEVACSQTAISAVVLGNGERVVADAIVVCAGAWSGAIRGLPHDLPVVPVRGQMLALERLPRLLTHMVMTEDCYIVPRNDGRILVGATVEHAGFDARTTADGIAQLLSAALRAVPGLREAGFVESWAGLRPGTPDDLPILGPDPRVHGLYYATGHFRNGILLAPVTADLMASAVLGAPIEMDIAPFSARRFHG